MFIFVAWFIIISLIIDWFYIKIKAKEVNIRFIAENVIERIVLEANIIVKVDIYIKMALKG